MSDLGTFGGSRSEAYGINDSGKVVGFAEDENGYRNAFLFDGSLHSLGVLSSYANSINEYDDVVGYYFDSKKNIFLWNEVDGIQEIDGLANYNDVAHDINDLGQIVGESTILIYYFHAFLYDGIMSDLGTLGGEYSVANAINNIGQIVGKAKDADNETHAFLWNSQNGMEDINPSDAFYSEAIDINEQGIVVGYFLGPSPTYIEHAFVYYNNVFLDLNNIVSNNSGWSLRFAQGINDQGQIAGYGFFNNRPRAFLLEPDSDSDGMPDSFEITYFGNNSRDGNDDYDADGVTDYQEYLNETNPIINIDTDSDSMPDDWEINYFGDLTQNGTDDFDNDGLTDLAEYENGTDPTSTDTDSDGMSDLFEITYFGNIERDGSGY